jgi:SAM-dependent methyltransferase
MLSIFEGKPKTKTYLPLAKTLREAEASGLSLSDFIDKRFGMWDGAGMSPTEQTINRMSEAGVFDTLPSMAHICEIGPGTGRYLEKTLRRCNHACCEIYETDDEWRAWLAAKHKAVAHAGDDKMSGTASASVDLAKAHRVFTETTTLVTLSYFKQMARVVKPGGWIVFDIFTEICFSTVNVEAWFKAGADTWHWRPTIMSKELALTFLTSEKCDLIKSYLVPYYPGASELLIFRKRVADAVGPNLPATIQ